MKLSLTPLFPLCAAIVVIAFALQGIAQLHQRVDDSRRAETALARLEAHADRLSRAEWEGRSEGVLSEAGQREMLQARNRIEDELGLLRRLRADVGHLEDLLVRHEATLDQGVHLLGEGRVETARRLGRNQIATTFKAVKIELHRLAASQSVAAVRTSEEANNGSLAIGLFTLVVVGFAVWRFHRLRESNLLAEAERRALLGSERRFRSLVENGTDVNLLLAPNGALLYVGAAVERTLGHDPEKLRGTSWLDLVHPEDQDRAQRLLAGSGTPGIACPGELRLLRADQKWTYFEAVANSRMDDPDLGGIVVNCWEITERKQVELALRRSEERYALAARGANDGLWDWDLVADRIYLSPRWWSMLGYSEAFPDSDPSAWLGRVHPRDLPSLRAALEQHCAAQKEHFQCEYQIAHCDGGYRWMLCRGLAVRDAGGKAIRLAGSQTDITERKAAEDQLLHAAFHDELTGLPNRTLLTELLATAIQRRQAAPERHFAVLFLDLDRFKTINDSLGHLIGDRLLIAVAKRLLSCVRAGDTVARLGGDEFAVLVDGIEDQLEAERIADRIQRELQHAFDLDGYEVYASASIGIAGSTLDYERPDEVLRDADTAMYAAKFLGKARYAVFDEHMHARVVSQLNLENDLRRALEKEELFVRYQPVIRLADEAIAGFEALVRWKHPERGEISPAEFIGLAEDSGLIVAIDQWVLRQACRQLRDWRQDGCLSEDFTVSVNLSTRHLSQPGLIEEIDRLLEESGVPGHSLRLEITESAVIENSQIASELFEQLHERGIRISMDDFGTGYSSLGYLHRFPFDLLKIDRSFLAAQGTKEGWDVVHTIISLARVMGMEVVAEGVESYHQAERLHEMGCSHAQGYVFSAAVDAELATELLSAGRRDRTPALAGRA